MALRPEYTLHHSEFGNFLYAPIWEGQGGASPSVLSMLARLDMDPWAEAARLAALPRQVAAASLAEILSQVPRNANVSPDDGSAADRLVGLLPPGVSTASARGEVDGRHRAARDARLWFVIALLATVTALVANGSVP
jgi:hypothetical protein